MNAKKGILTCTFFTLLFFNSFAQTSFNDTGKLASLCKVWGMLKYYHPEVATGKMNWDSVLFTKIPIVLNTKNKEELSKVYIDWINGLGDINNFAERPNT